MSGFEDGSINLDEERKIYYAGQILSGNIEFGLNQPLQFKDIKLVFHGEANVSWEDEETQEFEGVRSKNIVEYGGVEVFFHVEQCICGGVGVSQLEAGGHAIPFRFQVPATVPSSFGDSDDDDDDEERSIIYFVKAILEYHDGRPSEELYHQFDVVVPLDLNVNPEMQVQNEVIFEEVLRSCLCGGGLLNLVVWLPATGFCPGMVIPVSVKADNQSSVEITKIMFELVQRVKYSSTNPLSRKEEPEHILHYSKTGAIPSKTTRNFEHNFEIPALIPIITQNCNIIKVGYYFKVKVSLSGCNNPLEDEFQIVLGQIPIREMAQDYKHPLQHDLPRGPVPKPGEPPAIIQPYIYPSNTIQVVNNYAPMNAYPNNQAPGFQGPSPPYPGAVPAYPSAIPYPGASQPYPNANQPYPNANQPYPGANPPYPTSAGPPTNPVIGFVTPASPYPTPTGAPAPFSPSAPPE